MKYITLEKHPVEFAILRLIVKNPQNRIVPALELHSQLNKTENIDNVQFYFALVHLETFGSCKIYFLEDGTKMVEFHINEMNRLI